LEAREPAPVEVEAPARRPLLAPRLLLAPAQPPVVPAPAIAIAGGALAAAGLAPGGDGADGEGDVVADGGGGEALEASAAGGGLAQHALQRHVPPQPLRAAGACSGGGAEAGAAGPARAVGTDKRAVACHARCVTEACPLVRKGGSVVCADAHRKISDLFAQSLTADIDAGGRLALHFS
jgi:hypothetical protein